MPINVTDVVGGSQWKIQIIKNVKKKLNLVIAEEYQPLVDPIDSKLKLLRAIHLSIQGNAIEGKVLAEPKVICRQGDILVIQFVTHRNTYIQFLVMDMAREQCFIFSDSVQHFSRSYSFFGSMECCLSPDLQMMVLRLPQCVGRSHISPLALVVNTRYPSRPMNMTENPINVTDKSKFHDRKLRILLFDPRFPRRMLSMQVSAFCTKCVVLLRDQDSDTTVTRGTIRMEQLDLGQPSAAGVVPSVHLDRASDAGSESEDSDSGDMIDLLNLPPMMFKTVSCRAEYCRTADRIVLCCLQEDAFFGNMIVRIFILDADDFSFLDTDVRLVEVSDEAEVLGSFQIYFSLCDTKVHVFLPGAKNKNLLCSLRIPRPSSLKSACRVTILKTLSHHSDVQSLPVPSLIKRYLSFEANKYSGLSI